MYVRASADDYPLPPARRLRTYAFDPQASVELQTAVINDVVVRLPWETRWEGGLQPGPVNDYLEVVDYDPGAGVFYEPVDLDDPVLLAQDGLPPSEGRPQFHQQMVFAVAMRTIRSFERALGRVVLWAGDKAIRPDQDPLLGNFTPRLRIYPHALREANAYYSPEKRALLFGYFRPTRSGTGSGAGAVDSNWIFTCLSQDIVAHETTHAILHGIQRRSIEPATVDALAFHEAFADIVALMQHFGMNEVVRHELARSGGSLRELGLLTGLAQQFGRATGAKGALRYALIELLTPEAQAAGGTGSAPPPTPTPTPAPTPAPASTPTSPPTPPPTLATTVEPHKRGGFLVAAVFDAFVTIYERRTADLMRLGRRSAAGRSTGPGDAFDLPPELVDRLAAEAGKAADHVLRMCVRALDYIPPVALRFGEYLRAIVTADTDLVPDDPLRYRVAFVEAFRKRRITVPGCISMAPDSLLWAPPDRADYREFAAITGATDDPLSAMFAGLLAQLQLSVAFDGQGSGGQGSGGQESGGDRRVAYAQADFGGPRNLRELSMRVVLHNQRAIHAWLDADTPGDEDWERLLGMRLLAHDHRLRKAPVPPLRSITSRDDDTPLFEVNSARLARRAGPNGEELHQLIVHLIQRRRAYFDKGEQAAADAGRSDEIGAARWADPDFWFRGGATLHVDLRDGRLIRIIRKRIDCDERLQAERDFRTGDDTGAAGMMGGDEPFALLHRGWEW
ncbi:hypothetical protein [Sphingomonas bacterium]|uniref:hypothetical protein n=1 Tax=Sphingomonas bacterium TaxID=1895847 RepID=UPI001574EED3|nr:hypothetical protein [Sphingomonas bacterium]